MYLHSKGVAFNLLNPANILHLVHGPGSAVKIIDFDYMGANQIVHDMDKHLGTEKRDNACYIAPETIHGKWSIKCDEWAVGCMLYFMLTGNPPFWSDNHRDTLKQIMNYKFDMQSDRWRAISEEGRHLIQSLMSFRHEDRITAENALKHGWFKLAQRGELDSKDISEALGALKSFHSGSRLKQAVHSFFV